MPLMFGDTSAIKSLEVQCIAKQRRLKMPEMPKEKTPMTLREIYAAGMLEHCTFLPASWDKRFARDVAAIFQNDKQLTGPQRWNLWRMVYRYRRQIKDATLVKEAEQYLGASASDVGGGG